MEIKQITGKQALERAENRLREAAEAAERRIRAELEEELSHLRDAAAGVETLQTGIGTLLDRAAAVFVTTFEAFGFADTVPIGGAELRFPVPQLCVRLDPHPGSPTQGPRLDPKRHYRVVVLIEPVD